MGMQESPLAKDYRGLRLIGQGEPAPRLFRHGCRWQLLPGTPTEDAVAGTAPFGLLLSFDTFADDESTACAH